MIKSFKYRILPTKKQKELLISTLITCRFLYNNSLAERIEKYKEDKTSITYTQQANNLAENKNDYQKKVHSQVLQDVLKRLDKTYANFFRRIKNKEKKAGFPRFKPEQRYNSFCYPQSGFRLTNNEKRIELSKIGDIRIKYHRPIPSKPKTCIVVRDIDQWFVVFTCEIEDRIIEKSDKPEIGIDVGISNYLTLSNGKTFDNPRTLIKSQDKLVKAQRQLSKKVIGSKNRTKQRIVVAKTHRKIRNQRNDFLHKLSTHLVQEYGLIVFENLNIRNMVKNHKLAKHISDASWNKLIQMTTYKAVGANCVVELVDPKNTSQNCSVCGNKVSKTLGDRVHKCPACGVELDRDLNAAINIKNRAGTVRIKSCGDDVRQEEIEKSKSSRNLLRNKKPHGLSVW